MCATLRRMSRRLDRPSSLATLTALAALAAMALLLAAACDSNIEPYVEGEAPRHPDVERILPDTGARSPASGVRASATSPGTSIRGRIEISPELAQHAPERAVLYLMARPASALAAPPVAVKRLEATSFPAAFEIGSENMMAPDSLIRLGFRAPCRPSRRARSDPPLPTSWSPGRFRPADRWVRTAESSWSLSCPRLGRDPPERAPLGGAR